jgi:hypothetical protein
VAAPSYVFTIGHVAEMLGQDQEWLHELAMDMEPEDGCLTILDTGDRSTTAFTRDGIEYLKQLIADRGK